MTVHIGEGWTMTPTGPQKAVQDKNGGWWVPSENRNVDASRVFSTEAACVAGREPGKRSRPKHIRVTRTHAAMTAEKDED